MNLFNGVKLFYTTTKIFMITFIWALLISTLFRLNITFELFFIIFIGSNIARYLFKRGTNTNWSLLTGIVAISMIEFFLSKDPFLATLNITFASIVLLKLLSDENSEISYQDYKKEFIRGIYYIFIGSIIYSIISLEKGQNSYSIFIGILAYVILAIITLREAMVYECNIKSSKVSKIINYILAGLGLLLTQDFVYSKLIYITEISKQGINYVLSYLVELFLNLLKYPVTLIFSLFEKFTPDSADQNLFTMYEDMDKVRQIDTIEVAKKTGMDNPVITNILKILIILVCIYLFFKVANKIYYRKSKTNNKEYTEVIESIEKSKNTKGKLKYSLKKIFRKKGSPREEILYKYGEFIDVATKKKIFKSYMTPSQLKNVIKIRVKSNENISIITDLYNEAKFSTHNISDNKKNDMIKNVNKLNKTMK